MLPGDVRGNHRDLESNHRNAARRAGKVMVRNRSGNDADFVCSHQQA